MQVFLPLLVQLTALSQIETGTTAEQGAVRADRAHGYRIAPEASDDGVGRRLLRGVLFVPRALTTIVFAPIRGGLWLLETYDVPEFLVDVFFNDERTFGVFPILVAESGFGVGVGARLIARDILAEDTRFALKAGYGGRVRQLYTGELSTGRLIADWFELGLEGRYEDRPKDYFFGIGASSDDLETRVQRRRGQGAVFAHIVPIDMLRFTASGVIAHWVIQDPEGAALPLDPIGPRFDLTYQELLVELDTRRPAHRMIPESTPSSGIYLGTAGSMNELFSEPNSRYGRWSVDGEWLIDLYHGDRVLALRGYVESVTGRLDEIPIVELPSLGGPRFLRGYERDRFRDRAAVLGSVEYRFPVAARALGYLFVDTGRVFATLEEFSFRTWSLGFGGGFDLFTRATDLLRVQAAGSKDGDFQFALVFGADLDHGPRRER